MYQGIFLNARQKITPFSDTDSCCLNGNLRVKINLEIRTDLSACCNRVLGYAQIQSRIFLFGKEFGNKWQGHVHYI